MDEHTQQIRAKAALYDELGARLRELIADQTDFIANISNFSALLFTGLPQLNWAGFYLLHGTDLVLGPFQGKPACSLIATGDGVCGQAALQRAAVVVPDVRSFPGHIRCDEASQSEMVLPLFKDGRLVGVLDMDSPVLRRFDTTDSEHVQRLLQQLMVGTEVPESRLGPADQRCSRPPAEDDPGTLTDEEYLSAGGPDALDSTSDAADSASGTGGAVSGAGDSTSKARDSARQ